MKLLDKLNKEIKLDELVNDIVSRFNKIIGSNTTKVDSKSLNSKNDASNRLKLVLMHDRSNLPPSTMEQMRDELVDVISKYVEIDRDALDLNLESESNTIALVANIPILRNK